VLVVGDCSGWELSKRVVCVGNDLHLRVLDTLLLAVEIVQLGGLIISQLRPSMPTNRILTENGVLTELRVMYKQIITEKLPIIGRVDRSESFITIATSTFNIRQRWNETMLFVRHRPRSEVFLYLLIEIGT
jgi:hypothetical protein